MAHGTPAVRMRPNVFIDNSNKNIHIGNIHIIELGASCSQSQALMPMHVVGSGQIPPAWSSEEEG
jgi:hypothetical protein